ncbi:MAG: hemerythrin domain-containing protein [Gammaproteobacteria bacterium]
MSQQSKPQYQSTLDALDLLQADHNRVKFLFSEFDSLRGMDDEDERKARLVDEICYELTVHSMIEEELVYPRARAVIDNDELMDEADIEHSGALELVSQLEVMYPGDDHYEATVSVLAEEIAHHIEKEEDEMFPAMRASGIDLVELAADIRARKDELDEDISAPPPADRMAPHDGVRHPPRAPN